jgi:flagellar biosynthesis/type III secretory pathway protein FliH
MKKVVISLIVAFAVGYYFGHINVNEKIVYQPKIEYIKDPNSVSKSVLDSEVANAKKSSYNAGYAEGRKTGMEVGYAEGRETGMEEGYAEGREIGIDEGYKSGYIQGTEYGKNLILDQIDLRVQEAERTNKNIPLFRVKRE